MFKHVLNAVEERLKRVKELRYISIDWGQADEGMQPAVKFPCALVDLRQVDLSRMNSEWRAEAGIRVRVIAANLTNVSAEAPSNQKGHYERFCEVVEKTIDALLDYAAEDLQPLRVEGIERVIREDRAWEYVISLAASWVVKKQESKTIELNVEVKK